MSEKKLVIRNRYNYYPNELFAVDVTETGRVTVKGEVKSYCDKRNVSVIVARTFRVTLIGNRLSIRTESRPNRLIHKNIVCEPGLNLQYWLPRSFRLFSINSEYTLTIMFILIYYNV